MNTNDHRLDARTLAFYEANATAYLAARPTALAPELSPFLNLLPPGARILELGCGGGDDALGMEALGFDVDATDGSPAMAAAANKKLRRGARPLRFHELDDVAAYDAVVAVASLLHVPREGLPEVLVRVHRALVPGGWHYASYKTAAQPGRDSHGRWYNRLGADDARALYTDAGDWARIACDEFDGVGYFSEPTRWLTVTAQKAG